jgi:hypothetical protein
VVQGFKDLTGNTIANDCSENYNHPFSGSGNTAGNSIGKRNSSNT